MWLFGNTFVSVEPPIYTHTAHALTRIGAMPFRHVVPISVQVLLKVALSCLDHMLR